MRRLICLALLALPALLWMFSGCTSSSPNSGDDGLFDTTGTGGLVNGDTSDSEFQSIEGALGSIDAISGQMLGFLDFMIDTLRQQPNWLGTSPSLTPAADTLDFDSFHVSYHSNTGFWYFNFSSTDTLYEPDSLGNDVLSDIWTIVVEDSIRFRQDYSYQQWPDTSRVNQITLGVAFTITSQSGLVNMQVGERVFIDGNYFTGGAVTLYGTGEYDIDMSFLGCTMSVDMDLSLDDLAIDVDNLGDGCPASGSLSLDGTSSMSCSNGDSTISESDSYSITQTFNGSTVHLVAEDATTRWEITESCSPSAAPSIGSLPQLVADRFMQR